MSILGGGATMFTKVKKAKIENCVLEDNVVLDVGGAFYLYYTNKA